MAFNNLAIDLTVTEKEIEQILRLRRLAGAQKRRFNMAQTALEEIEASVLGRIQQGAPIESSRAVQIQAKVRRNAPWKSVVVEIVGAEKAEHILRSSKPNIQLVLQIDGED